MAAATQASTTRPVDPANTYARPIAGAIALSSAVIGALTVTLITLNANTPGIVGLAGAGPRIVDAIFSVAILAYPLVGALIIASNPRNRIGWILGAGILLALGNLAHEFAIYGLLTRPELKPLGEISAWVVSWLPPAVIFPVACSSCFSFQTGDPFPAAGDMSPGLSFSPPLQYPWASLLSLGGS